jgi:acyl dehydratase
MSTASTMMCAPSVAADIDETPVSVGYDRVRLLKGVRLNATITVTYQIKEIDPARRRSRSAIEVTNHSGEVVAFAEQVLQWVKNPKGQAA